MGLVERFRSWVTRGFGPAPRCLLCNGLAPAPSTACPDCVLYTLECIGAPEGFFDPFAEGENGLQDAPKAPGGTSGAGGPIGAVDDALERTTSGFDGPEG